MGKKSKPPPAPDYTALAEQTAASNAAAVKAQTEANRVNQTNPYGSLTWSQDPSGKWSQNIALNEAEQRQLDANRAIQSGLTDTASGLLGQAKDSLGRPLTTEGLPAWQTVDPSKLPQGGSADNLMQGVGPINSQLPQGNYGPMGSISGGAPSIGGGGGGNINFGKLGEFGSMAGYKNKNDMDAGFGAVKEVQDAMLALTNPGREQARQSEIQRLKSQGITEDSPAWTRAMQRLETGDMENANRALLAATGEYGNIFNRGLAQNEQGFGQGLDIANLTDRQRAQRLQEQATQGQFDEGRASRALQGGIAGAQIGAQRDIAGANLASQNQNQLFNQALQGARFGNEASSQQFGQNLEQQRLAAALRGQSFDEQMAGANMTAAQRNQMLNEQERLRQSPLNDLRSLMGDNPANPNFAGFATEGNAGGTDYSGAGSAQYKAAMDAYNAKQAQRGGLMGGLFGLAGTALGGPIGGAIGSKVGGWLG